MIYIVLAIIGAFVGAFINWCIYNFAEKKRAISPWFAETDSTVEKIPFIGWWFRRKRGTKEFGQRYWIRPMLIELVWIVGLPWFYHWQIDGGLIGGVAPPANCANVWFIGHSILFALLFISTFIDFDERIIPDSVTVPGTLIALVFAVIWPDFRLPEVGANAAGPVIQPIHFADGQELGIWHHEWQGLACGIGIFAIWILALLPKWSLLALDWKSIKVVFITTYRFLQKNNNKRRTKARRLGMTLLFLGLIGCIGIALGWKFLPAANWDSLFGALIGLGFGGMMIWSVRIVASHSLKQEAMGFGDVTLMAMIGAFLGWQASLLVFGVSPFTALAIVLVNYIITRDNELAFGPYLCLGTVLIVLNWHWIWPQAELQFFRFPSILISVLAGCLVLLMLMMREYDFLKTKSSPMPTKHRMLSRSLASIQFQQAFPAGS